MTRTVFAPYNLRVSATRELAEKFDSFCILPEGSKFRPRAGDVVVNWGRRNLPDMGPALVLNKPAAVAACVNKLTSFNVFKDANVPTVEYTTDHAVAEQWVRDGDTVIARDNLAGMGGMGIRIISAASHPEGFARARLYTKYAKRKHEYRVHVFRGKVIDAQQKKRRNGAERTPETNMVRSYANGWVFCRENVVVPECVRDAAIAAVTALGLDFGGVDVGWNEHYNRAYVYEVNSAPGIEGTTVENYYAAISGI